MPKSTWLERGRVENKISLFASKAYTSNHFIIALPARLASWPPLWTSLIATVPALCPQARSQTPGGARVKAHAGVDLR